jgi:pyruvate formate lyase activating enzyme
VSAELTVDVPPAPSVTDRGVQFMDLRGLTQLSLLDYPGRLVCVVFCGGCNFRCGYCQNPYLVLYPETQPALTAEAVLAFLRSRVGKLDGVVISGGEPTIHRALPEFMAQVKELGFLVRLDTNGSNPRLVRKTHEAGLLDSLGLDFKAPLARYQEVAVCPRADTAAKVAETIRYAASHGLDLDVRTTVHRHILSPEDLAQMRRELDELGVGRWHLQQFHPVEIIDESLVREPTYSDAELKVIAASLGPHTHLRGTRG